MAEAFDLGSLTEEFRDEARQQVDRLDTALLALEREGSLSGEERSHLLRTLHTLKGNAGMLGFAEIRDFVHVLENVLKAAPEGGLSGELVELLFEGAGALRRGIEEAGSEDAGESDHALAAARRRLEEAATGAAAAPRTDEPAPERPEGGESSDLLRVPFSKLDRLLNEVGELAGQADALLYAESDLPRTVVERAEAVRRRAESVRATVMSLRLVPVGRVLGRFPGLVRRLAREEGKEARLVLEGESTEMDKTTADALAEPLLHLVRNAIDHGIEDPQTRERKGKPRHGTLTIRAQHEGDRVCVEVEDDGAGIPIDTVLERARERGLIEPGETPPREEVLNLIFRSGFSTRTEADAVSGQGLGLDVVRRSVRALRGELEVEEPDAGGTRFVLRLPLTVALVPSLIFEAGGEVLAVPATSVRRTLRIGPIERVGATEMVSIDEELLPLTRLGQLFGWGRKDAGGFAVVIRGAARSAAIVADRLIDQRELVVKALPSYGAHPAGVSAASVLPGGGVILLLDPVEVIELNLQARGGRE